MLGMVVSGCSGGSDKRPRSAPSSDGGNASETVVTNAALGRVRGPLGRAKSDAVLTGVTKVVDAWIDAAYGGDYPRTDFKAGFGAFTPQARRLAVKQSTVMTNAEVGAGLTGVELTRRKVLVDVLSVGRRARGATARVWIEMRLAGKTTRTDLVTGRLLLTPTKQGWTVFGFDVRRGKGGAS
ncbi:hypothetical protein GCM10022237_27470 [Nocardioides ginsengisoli]